ncbi:ParA family protein [Aeromonas dhakensis]|uniref:ParA family protein n=1 Tax=Aeromonas dhakensis TaxID=196024 RepID=UPI001B375481|nr:ParA family protein [Aeromonas dhakensis]
MKSVAIFNNKGGVGKSTLTHHLGCALSEMGIRTLMIDLDPQSNLSLFSLNEEEIEKIWSVEDEFIADYFAAKSNIPQDTFNCIHSDCRSIHYILKPVEDGQSDEDILPRPWMINSNLGLIPGRLTLHMFENKVAKQWSDAFLGESQALRTISAVRNIAIKYASEHAFDVVLIDTSPSLGVLNKVIISNSDAFIIPCAPDMLSNYGIRNIGSSLALWLKEHETMFSMLSDSKRQILKSDFVKLLGYTIYNAKKRSDANNPMKIAKAHFNWAQKLPTTIDSEIPPQCYNYLGDTRYKSIGDNSIIHGHSTMPTMAQKYKKPIWAVPDSELDPDDRPSIQGNKSEYIATQELYHRYAADFLARLEKV